MSQAGDPAQTDRGAEYDPRAYGALAANTYDDTDAVGERETALAVETLFALAGGRPVRELAAGTGRGAIPLARRGLEVSASDISPDMLAVLRTKSGAELLVEVVEEDMAASGSPSYGLVAILLNSLFGLLTAEHQQAAFAAAASWLQPGGLLVVEHAVPNLLGRAGIERGRLRDGCYFKETTYVPATQRATLHFTLVRGEVASARTIELRFVWPAECDLMAGAAGLRLVERWEDWERRPFTPASLNAVSVYEKL